MTSKVVVRKVDRSYYCQVMAIFLLACKEMVTRMKKLDFDDFSSLWFRLLLSSMVPLQQEFNSE